MIHYARVSLSRPEKRGYPRLDVLVCNFQRLF